MCGFLSASFLVSVRTRLQCVWYTVVLTVGTLDSQTHVIRS